MPTPLTPAPPLRSAPPPERGEQAVVSLADRMLGQMVEQGRPKPKRKTTEDVQAANPAPSTHVAPPPGLASLSIQMPARHVAMESEPALSPPLASMVLLAPDTTVHMGEGVGEATEHAIATAFMNAPGDTVALPGGAKTGDIEPGHIRLEQPELELPRFDSFEPDLPESDVPKPKMMDKPAETLISAVWPQGGRSESSPSSGALRRHLSPGTASLSAETVDMSPLHEYPIAQDRRSESPATLPPEAGRSVALPLTPQSVPAHAEAFAQPSAPMATQQRDIDRFVATIALQQTHADKPSTGQLHYAFRSWGGEHAVTAKVAQGSLVFQPSSPRVSAALAAAMPDGTSDMPWRIEAVSAADDEDATRKRRG